MFTESLAWLILPAVHINAECFDLDYLILAHFRMKSQQTSMKNGLFLLTY